MATDWAVDLGYKAVLADDDSGAKGPPDYFACDAATPGPRLGILYKF